MNTEKQMLMDKLNELTKYLIERAKEDDLDKNNEATIK